MILTIIFLLIAVATGYFYFFDRERFSPIYLLLTLWSAALSIAQLRLSILEKPFSSNFWLLITLFFGLLIVSYFFGQKFLAKKIKASEVEPKFNRRLILIIISSAVIIAIAANIGIWLYFGTMPILSTIPDQMRFIINKKIFGPIQYAALLPRLYIPLIFIYLYKQKEQIKALEKKLLITAIVIGFMILSLYAARLHIVTPILISYFSYLIIKGSNITFKQLLKATLIAAGTVLIISSAIPAFRQFITYRDYISKDESNNPYSYIVTISKVELPRFWQFITPVYLVPAFNLQALDRSIAFYSGNYAYGRVELSAFNSLFRILHLPKVDFKIAWDKIFLSWWVTATFLVVYFIDFGFIGIALAAIIWGLGLAALNIWPRKRPTLLAIFLFAYFNFIVIMTIYNNYFQRPELYIDLLLIIAGGLILQKMPNIGQLYKGKKL